MKKEEIGFLGSWALGLILLIATMIIIRWIISFVTWTTLDSGWAQALGSMIAIFAGFALARWQLQQNREDEKRRQNAEKVRRLETVLAIFQQIDEMAHEVLKAAASLNTTALGQTPWLHLTDRSTYVRSLPLFEIPSAEVIREILKSPRAIDRLAEIVVLLYPQVGVTLQAAEASQVANAALTVRVGCREVIMACNTARLRLV